MAKVGSPPKYKTVDEMVEKIDQYFEKCAGRYLENGEGELVFDKYGRPILVDSKPPTITGLALALGFNSRQSLLNYQSKKEFMDTITRAKATCEEYAESRLFDRDGQRGAEFSLRCNFRWRDSDDSMGENKPEEDPLSVSLAKLANEMDDSDADQ